MRGVSMPSYQHLFALSTWLTFDINQMVARDNAQSIEAAASQKVEFSEDTIRLAKLLSGLPSDTQSLLFNLVSNLKVG